MRKLSSALLASCLIAAPVIAQYAAPPAPAPASATTVTPPARPIGTPPLTTSVCPVMKADPLYTSEMRSAHKKLKLQNTNGDWIWGAD
jgi:hypothetical protein